MRKRGKAIKGRFIALRYEMMDSPAWKELKPSQVCVYLQIARQYNGYNAGQLKAPYSQMGLASATVRKAIKKLKEVGLIDIIEEGGLYKHCTVYGLSERWRLYKRPLLAKSIEVFRK